MGMASRKHFLSLLANFGMRNGRFQSRTRDLNDLLPLAHHFPIGAPCEGPIVYRILIPEFSSEYSTIVNSSYVITDNGKDDNSEQNEQSDLKKWRHRT